MENRVEALERIKEIGQEQGGRKTGLQKNRIECNWKLKKSVKDKIFPKE